MTKLEELRIKIREIDKELVGLISERLKLASEIGEKKQKHGIPLRDFTVEKNVIDNAAAEACKKNVPDELVKNIMQMLISESCIRQEQLHYSAYSGGREKILVIGGLGGMGRWLCHFFQSQGHSVTVYDLQKSDSEFRQCDSMEEGLENSTCAVLSVSIDATPELIKKITDFKYTGVVFDITSLKALLLEPITEAVRKGIAYTSIHPMFGPNARTLSDKIICFCRCGSSAADRKVEGFFAETSVSRIQLPLLEHDRLAACVLGLSHIINIIFAKTLLNSGFTHAELLKIASTTFISQMVTTESVIRENPELYYSIQKNNPFRSELYDHLSSAVAEVTGTVQDGRREEFVRIMQEARAWMENS
ncbi:MAG: prephenate dehydrogenase/arogenate dehydrogenase family protein [Candidatus Wallbacteria bacterium]|nr:prephenate dehydrogenase/arogenate dehydrogenase family protein [Candidatus Wallbacteria bacterium]